MKLSVLDRLVASNLLPTEGSFTNLKLIRVAKETLSFNEKENKLLQFKQTGDQVVWNQTVVVEKEVEIGEVVSLIIMEALKKLDSEGKLKEEHISLYEKFIK